MLSEGQVQDDGQPIDVAKSQLLPPEELIKKSIDRLKDATDLQEKTHFCLIALAVCTSMGEDNPDATDFAALVWAQTLDLDQKLWIEWLKTQPDLTDLGLRQLVLDTTLFGALVKECRKADALKDVAYGRHIEGNVLKKLPANMDGNEMARLLRSVTMQKESMQGKSLVVAHY